MVELAGIPHLGVGIGFRPEIADAVFANAGRIDFVEIIADNFMHRGRRELERLCATFPVIPHGLNLSIGRAAPLDRAYLAAAKRVSDLTGAPYYSDHLALTSVPGVEIGHLFPLWHTEEGLEATIRNVRLVQDVLEKPLVLENITYDVELPGATISQPQFFRALCEETGCGILFDVTNLHINAVNHGFSVTAFLNAFPVEHVVQTHLAGGVWCGDRLVDGHCGPVHEEAWALFETLARRVPVRGTIIERDAEFGPFEDLLAELARAGALLSAGGRRPEAVAA